jgi:adenosylhomocysteine nucleosidase
LYKLKAIIIMESIGLIAAMSQESNALLRYVKRWKRMALGKFDGKSFEVYEHNCVLFTSGMGTRRASEAVRELIKAHAPRLLISFGIAGAVEADLEIGDVVVPEVYCELVDGVQGSLMPLNLWPDNALKAAAFAVVACGAHLVTGTAVTTGGSVVAGDQLRDLKHPILEMETAGIAQVARESGVPILSMRAISDGPRAPIPFNLNEIMDEDANLRACGLMMAIVRHPVIVFQLRGLIQNNRIAAANAAMAVINALSSQDI